MQAGAAVPRSSSLRDAALFVLVIMWAVFIATYLIFDQFRYLKIADFFLYAGSSVIVPVLGYVEYRSIQGIVLPAARRLMFETFAMAITAASTFVRPATAPLLLVVVFLARAALATRMARRASLTGSGETSTPA